MHVVLQLTEVPHHLQHGRRAPSATADDIRRTLTEQVTGTV